MRSKGKDEPIEVEKSREFLFTMPETDLKTILPVLKRAEDDLRFSYEDTTGADIVKLWVERFTKALEDKGGRRSK